MSSQGASSSSAPQVPDVHQCQGLPRHSVGLEESGLEVQGNLTDTKVLGIVGVGGVGKTTIAKHVFNAISKEFEYTCFVDNVKDIPVHELHNCLLGNFYQSGQRIVGRKISWVDLQKKKALVVMDDVDSMSQLKVLPQLNDLGVGSRFIITTRDEGILGLFESYYAYRVKFLEDVQAEKLFCQYAGLEDILDSSAGKNELKTNVQLIVKKCGGLPLTLEVLGCHLWGHANDANYWEQTIDTLNKAEPISGGRNDRVWDTWRIYNGLAPEEQKMFIEAAIYFFGKPLDRALFAWNGAYKNAETRWAELISRSMVNTLSKKDYNGVERPTVWVDQQLRDLAESLAKGYMVAFGPSLNFDTTLNSLNADEVDENTGIVFLLNFSEDEYLTLKFDFLMKLRHLKYLDVVTLRPRGKIKAFPRELSLLHWSVPSECTAIFPQIGHNELSNLAVLELAGWEMPKEFPEALGNLTNLRILALEDLKGLNYLPKNFGNLSQLKKLQLFRLDLQDLPASFGYLTALETLTLKLPRLKYMPDSMFSHLRALRTLNISSNVLETLSDSLGQLASLQSLTIKCRTLRNLPDSIGDLAGLEHLSLDVPLVEALPPSMGQLSALRFLSISNLAVAYLPESFRQLSALRSLRIFGCHLEKLPDNFGNLSGVEDLEIFSDSLEELPDSLGNLRALEDLKIVSNSLEALPENLGELTGIKSMTIRSTSLRSLPSSMGKLRAMRNLVIDCRSLETLPESLGDLTRLDQLELQTASLLSIPESIGGLCSLTDLTINSKSLRNLPACLGKCSALKSLRINCDSLETLPDGLGNLSSLEKLHLWARSLVSTPESTPESTGQLSSLKSLNVNAANIRNLPSSFGQLSALRELHLRCYHLDKLPDNFLNPSLLGDLEIPAKSLDNFQQELLASLGWVLRRLHRVPPPPDALLFYTRSHI